LRAVIIANGEFNKPDSILSDLNEDDLIIAADGGAHHCLAIGLWPDFVIGDLDSITTPVINQLREHGTQLILYPRDKDQTDLELALSLAGEKGFQDVLLLGMFGGRLDQSLANILLLTRNEWKGLRLTISNDPDTAYLMRDQYEISLLGHPGDIVSLIPLSDLVEDVSTEGLRWSLDHADLRLGTTLSVSNELINTSALIQIGAGNLLVIHRDTTAVENEE
jgi:thiamine pyrophosphokinase